MQTLLSTIEAFCDAHGLAETRFGQLALNDKALISQMRAGRRLWPETAERVRAFMASFEAEAAQRAGFAPDKAA